MVFCGSENIASSFSSTLKYCLIHCSLSTRNAASSPASNERISTSSVLKTGLREDIFLFLLPQLRIFGLDLAHGSIRLCQQRVFRVLHPYLRMRFKKPPSFPHDPRFHNHFRSYRDGFVELCLR